MSKTKPTTTSIVERIDREEHKRAERLRKLAKQRPHWSSPGNLRRRILLGYSTCNVQNLLKRSTLVKAYPPAY
jgi:hypothetical protein